MAENADLYRKRYQDRLSAHRPHLLFHDASGAYLPEIRYAVKKMASDLARTCNAPYEEQKRGFVGVTVRGSLALGFYADTDIDGFVLSDYDRTSEEASAELTRYVLVKAHERYVPGGHRYHLFQADVGFLRQTQASMENGFVTPDMLAERLSRFVTNLAALSEAATGPLVRTYRVYFSKLLKAMPSAEREGLLQSIARHNASYEASSAEKMYHRVGFDVREGMTWGEFRQQILDRRFDAWMRDLKKMYGISESETVH
jgi:hypothetical protein